MDIILSSGNQGLSPQMIQQKEDAVLALLRKDLDETRYRHISALAKVFRQNMPLSYLVSLPEDQLAAWLKKCLELLESPRHDIAVRLEPFGGQGHVLLMTNVPDAPYLVDTVQSYLTSRHVDFHMIAHPILTLTRREESVVSIEAIDAEGPKESLILIDLEGVDQDRLLRIEQGVSKCLLAALAVQKDRKALNTTLTSLDDLASRGNFSDFWKWLQEGNFIPFAYQCLTLHSDASKEMKIQLQKGSSLGISFDPEEIDFSKPRTVDECHAPTCARLKRSRPVVVETLSRLSPVRRADPLVYIGVREETEDGRTQREHAFLGLFSAKSADELVFNIPSLRARIEQAFETLHISAGTHDYRKTVEIFNTFPKVELFFLGPEELVQTVRSFSLLYRHDLIKIVATPSLAVKGITLLVVMPIAYYSPDRMIRVEHYLSRTFKADKVTSRIMHVAADYLSLHVHVHADTEHLQVDLERLERGVMRKARPWELKLRLQLERRLGEVAGGQLARKFHHVFPLEYKTIMHPRYAVRDVEGIDSVLKTGEEILDLWGPFGQGERLNYRLQFYSLKNSYLNELIPFLENLNLCVEDEADYVVALEHRKVYIKSFTIHASPAKARKLSEIKSLLLEALRALRRQEVENDYLHQILVLTGLSWRQIDVFRGYRNYYFQIGCPYTKKRVAQALIHNPDVTLLLYRYFEARFMDKPEWSDTLQREEEALSPIRFGLVTALQAVTDVNEDNILRTLFNLIDSTVRTNFFLRADAKDYFFAFKISAIGIIDMPAPRPLYEIYVHSATMEGIHLRGGRVARGGIRWSDRPDDFRTEILGLMKTQMTKNAVIVPVGSKGGFIVKTPYRTREEGAALSKEAYQTLMRGLLDLTDNRVGSEVVRVAGIVAYDEEDPYLVVAADKGTAHLSDTANAVSREYGFWLDDAFASGGSHGYDHKALGITARGAWECVKGHFREMGHDIQAEPFTVVGIGDMSGDVFGNGMLLSRQIRLIGAFDHRHIFLDPDPDPAATYAERKRLFDLPRSSWDDFNRDLLSEGGGIYPRTAKEIPLSPQVRKRLGVRHESMDPDGLIQLLLTAEIDLLWNGGIGTYVKASTEKHEDAGDRTNDNLRIDANQLRARVVGEGGNLGFTQRGRIEYAQQGGRINTDAVDNSAGVDTSDHEVNLKIFMQYLKDKKEISGQAERDTLLGSVTDEVCEMVLADNYDQHLCLSLDHARCQADVEPYMQLVDTLARAGLLDRRGEFLPSSKEIAARQQQKFTRPELAILMAYSKMQLYQAILESDLPAREGARDFLLRYFPGPIRSRFLNAVPHHPLWKEITATVITNTVVNQSGSAYLNALAQQTGSSLVEATSAYLLFDRILDGHTLRQAVYSRDNRMDASRQHQLLIRLEDALNLMCGWALEHGLPLSDSEQEIAVLKEKLVLFHKALGGILPEAGWGACKADAEGLAEDGFDPDIAQAFSLLGCAADFLPLVTLADSTGGELYSIAHTVMEIRQLLGLSELMAALDGVILRDRWDRMASQSLLKGFETVTFSLARSVIETNQGNLDAFLSQRKQKLRLYQGLMDGLRGQRAVNFHPFTVLLKAAEALLIASPAATRKERS